MMKSNTKRILALVLVAVMVASAGCAGWGQDGPADNDTEQSNDSDDLGQTQNESENQSDSNASDDPNQSGDSSRESDNDDPDSSIGGSDPTESQSDSSDDTSDSDSSDDTSEDDSKSGSSGSDPGDDGSSSRENGAANGEDSDTSDESPSAGDDSNGDDDKDDTQDGENDTLTTPDTPDENESGPDAPDENETDPDDPDENETGNENESDPDAPDEGNTVMIDVIDLETDEPVEIPVRLTSGDFERTETATDGTAAFENIPDGSYDVRPAADGWWKEHGDEAGITVEGDTSHTMRVNDELDSHTLTVTVTDADTGEPIEGARLSAEGGRHPSGADVLIAGTTNSEGVATIDAYESGYIGNVDADGYEVSDAKSFNVDSDTSVSFELEPTDDGEPDTAPANAIDVESVKHGGAEPFTEYDRVALVNTHDELPLDVSGWSISVSDQTPEMPLGDMVIGPSETHVVVLNAEDKMLDTSGGVLQIYTADGSKVMSWNYVGSPSAPYLPPENGNESGDVNETNPSQTAAAV